MRARYRHLAGMIARDELDDRRRARPTCSSQAIEDDPLAFAAADELEALLAHGDDREALAAFYYKRLEHVRDDEGRPGERLRLWDQLGELLHRARPPRRRDRRVRGRAVSSPPTTPTRRKRLADLYVDATRKHDAEAIAAAPGRAARRTSAPRVVQGAAHALRRARGQTERARACDDALAMLGTRRRRRQARRAVRRAATAEHRRAAATRSALSERRLARARRSSTSTSSSRRCSRSSRRRSPSSARACGRRSPSPSEGAPRSRARRTTCSRASLARVRHRRARRSTSSATSPRRARWRCASRDGMLVPVLVFGRRARQGQRRRPRARVRARAPARRPAHRSHRPPALPARRRARADHRARAAPTASTISHAARWLTDVAPPGRARSGARARRARSATARSHPMTRRVGWLAATERAADRIGFVVAGDLATCVKRARARAGRQRSQPRRSISCGRASPRTCSRVRAASKAGCRPPT